MNIANYTEAIKVILGESAKYVFLLLFSVLSIRLWRRVKTARTARNSTSILVAVLFTAVTCLLGTVSIRHSMSLLYSHYGMEAFNNGKFAQGAMLFESSSGFWKTPDALGKKGICLLFANQVDDAKADLARAKEQRGGQSPSFEEFYQGLYCFLHDQPESAIPHLSASLPDPLFAWNSTKLLAVIKIDRNETADADALMQQFQGADIKDADHAYVVSSLKLAEGKANEAKAILDQFPPDQLSPRWKKRFDQVRARLPN